MKKLNYLTIKQFGTFELDIRKSRFIGHVQRIKNEAEAKQFINKIKDQNKKATHNCFGYVIGKDDHIQRKSDNGEPANTAGTPILDVIKMKHLHNVVVVITRYFGGIKLGAGGLIRAYSNITTDTINNTGIVQRILQTKIDVIVDYHEFNPLNYYLKQNHYNVINTEYTSKVTVTVAVNTPDIKTFKNKIISLLSNRVTFKVGKKMYFEVDYHQPTKNNFS
ncbi:YigZ family protein [Acetilactobacillus jinshanensis]|uniref:YigZ family protein n=1 Tax=Acetilactobacillus jinshanensis TaxID=1720083 RepID=A0A4P6ZM75_9LACO|nr:YigZ family protein [Acetilactobacillus jinshanensis]QBP18818.1 YigZ family protein [Acetilactobacillus jinshanensis]URL61685.1 YigZ family protein [uncultured bacterium]